MSRRARVGATRESRPEVMKVTRRDGGGGFWKCMERMYLVRKEVTP